MTLRLLALVVLCCTVSCVRVSEDGSSHDHAHDHDHDHAHDEVSGEPTALDTFLANNAIHELEGWLQVGLVHSDVTGGPRRVYVDKYAVVQALLNWRGEDEDGVPAPMAYEMGTVFVAENLDGDEVASTFVIEYDESGAPTFAAYDGDGAAMTSFAYLRDGEAVKGSVPSDCRACHLGDQVFPPMSAFPGEEPRVAVDVDARHRDAEMVSRFGETFTRGSGVFGPYGALLLSSFAADRRDERLAHYDNFSVMMLAQRYAAELGMDPGMFGDGDGEDGER